jgi:uncharacterized protein
MIEKIKEEAKNALSSARGSHDYDHTMRVYKLAMHIGKKENANMRILATASLLHDIGRCEEDQAKGQICHAESGAKIAEKILPKYEYNQEEIQEITHCIISHRFRGKNIPKSKEAKILFDADKLDSIGAVGIGRTFLFAGEIGAQLHNPNPNTSKEAEYTKEDTAYREFKVKLQHIKDGMLTKEGKRIAKKRHKYMVEFFTRLNKETDGKL